MENILLVICKTLEDNIPVEIQVIPYGRHDTPKGAFELDDAGADAIIAAFESQKNDMVVDYEHQTLAGTEAPAAGWIKKLINKGKEGIWASVEWTERAKKYLANKEYRYLSPVFLKRVSDNKVMKLINVALTNQPNIDGMVPLVNKLSVDGQQSATKQKEVSSMKELLKLLGLTGEATEEQAIVAVNKLLADKKALENKTAIVVNKGVLDALGLKEGATEAEITGTIMAMKQSHGTVESLSTELADIKAKLAEKEASDAVEQAVNDGKVTPAQKDWAMDYAKRDLAGFRVFVSKATVVIPQGRIAGNEKPADGALDATQLEINKQCGIDLETFKKYSVKEV
jgi:phage I-like protein